MKAAKATRMQSATADVRNAGGRWTNRRVVVDGDLITGRKPADIPEFNRHILKAFGGRRPTPH